MLYFMFNVYINDQILLIFLVNIYMVLEKELDIIKLVMVKNSNCNLSNNKNKNRINNSNENNKIIEIKKIVDF